MSQRSLVEEMPDEANCELNGSDISCDFYLQDEWQNGLHHEVSTIYNYGETASFRIHWVDGPEARKVGIQDNWREACQYKPQMYSTSHRGGGDRLRHIVCREADPQFLADAVQNSIERFDSSRQ